MKNRKKKNTQTSQNTHKLNKLKVRLAVATKEPPPELQQCQEQEKVTKFVCGGEETDESGTVHTPNDRLRVKTT